MEEFWRNLDESGGICERKILFQMKKEADQTGFKGTRTGHISSVGWFISLLVREEVLLAGLCERKILFRLKIYDRLC